jgi:hypothetical protein
LMLMLLVIMWFMSLHSAPFRQSNIISTSTLHLGADSRVKRDTRIIVNCRGATDPVARIRSLPLQI